MGPVAWHSPDDTKREAGGNLGHVTDLLEKYFLRLRELFPKKKAT